MSNIKRYKQFLNERSNKDKIKKLFLSLIQKTTPSGEEDTLLNYLPELQKDDIGNYYKVIGDNPSTMFTSHLDNHCDKELDVNYKTYIDGNSEFIKSDGKTILGADGKAGVTILAYMIENNIPGVYYFFIKAKFMAIKNI